MSGEGVKKVLYGDGVIFLGSFHNSGDFLIGA